jgi:hypothetical protein
VAFSVLGDGRVLWKSTPVAKAGVFSSVVLPVAGVHTVMLQVERCVQFVCGGVTQRGEEKNLDYNCLIWL